MLRDRHLEGIPNPILLHLKEKIIRKKFSLIHVPGSKNKTPDQERFSKDFLACMRAQPEQVERADKLEIEQITMGTATCSLAYVS